MEVFISNMYPAKLLSQTVSSATLFGYSLLRYFEIFTRSVVLPILLSSLVATHIDLREALSKFFDCCSSLLRLREGSPLIPISIKISNHFAYLSLFHSHSSTSSPQRKEVVLLQQLGVFFRGSISRYWYDMKNTIFGALIKGLFEAGQKIDRSFSIRT